MACRRFRIDSQGTFSFIASHWRKRKMKKILIAGLMGMISTAAFADFQVYESGEGANNRNEFSYECHFRAVGKKGGRCHARGYFELERNGNPRAAVEERNRERASIYVRCSDGFDLSDRHAHLDQDRNSVTIKGRDNGDSAKLEIFEDRDLALEERGGDREFRARLVTENSVDTRYRGSCEIRRERDRRGDTDVL